MSDSLSDRPNPARSRLLRSVFEPSTVGVVAEAISVATEQETRVYVERFPEGWRWSLAHRGGGYPLLRITARFLRVDYHRIVVGFRTLDNGYSILCDDPDNPRLPDAWAMVDFHPDSAPQSVEARILDVLAFGVTHG